MELDYMWKLIVIINVAMPQLGNSATVRGMCILWILKS